MTELLWSLAKNEAENLKNLQNESSADDDYKSRVICHITDLYYVIGTACKIVYSTGEISPELFATLQDQCRYLLHATYSFIMAERELPAAFQSVKKNYFFLLEKFYKPHGAPYNERRSIFTIFRSSVYDSRMR